MINEHSIMSNSFCAAHPTISQVTYLQSNMIICYDYRDTHVNSNTLDRTRRVNTDESSDGHQSRSDRKTGTAEVG